MNDDAPLPDDGQPEVVGATGGPATSDAATAGTATVPPFLEKEWVREFVTMALYVGLSLLAVLVALPPGEKLSETNLGLTMLVTAVALLFAHQIAFRLSSRLVNSGLLDAEGRLLLVAQIAGGLAVALVASVPIFILGTDLGVLLSEILLVGFVALVAYVAARSAPSSRLRSWGYVAFIVLGVLALVSIKSLLKH